MHRFFRHSAVLGLAGALLVSGTSAFARQNVQPASQAGTAAAANVDWPLWGNDTNNTRYSPLNQINASNVSSLGIAWTQDEGLKQTTFETVPLVVGGVMYYTTNNNQVRAVNAATGKLIWQYTPKVNFYEAIAGGGGGVPTNRGVTVNNNMVYLLTFDDQLIALQQSTGEKLWSTTVADASKGYSEVSPPTYFNGMLYVGSAEGDSGHRGFVEAYDANTGKKLWTFYTVPADGQGWVKKGTGVTGGDVWMPIVADSKTGLIYFGTGNPYPDFDNSQRPGCDPWVNSTVALNARTGKFVWAHSEVCNDIDDEDSDPSPVIFDAMINGKMVHAVGHASKVGLYFVYDAATGKVLAQSTYVTKYQHPVRTGTYEICPGYLGGFEYSPAAYSPLTHAVYNPALTACLIHKGPQVTIDVKNMSGTMAAIDVTTGKFLWRTTVPNPMVGGALATGSNLVFSGSDDGILRAFDAKTGQILWKGDIGLSFGAPPITYEVNGVQYIAVASGGYSAAALTGTTKKIGGTLVVFKLNGAPIKHLPVSTSSATTGLTPVITTKGMAKVNDYMYMDAKSKRVVIALTAAGSTANNGFNFDGYAKGKANFIVPSGWVVDFIFKNNQALPHSAAVIPTLKFDATVTPLVATPDATTQGLTGVAAQYASFTAYAPGKYYLACLIPGHIQAGMWDNFTVSASATAPSLVVSK